ncbi:MFS transporter [Alphaproteobacteria bacterium]|jgi:MFS family permease|nr:MFS transporter [Alphaproteobacteria bacterium]
MTDHTLSAAFVPGTSEPQLVMPAAPPLWHTVAMIWALLVGVGAAMLANGVQGPLFGVRATIEDFSTTMTGIVIAGYFVGFALGSLVVPTLVTRVGHIRVFAAVASLISIATILPPVFVNPWVWTLLRVFIGLGYAGLYIVAESWVNDAAPNANRGRLLSIYMVISLACMAAGPLLVNLADPGGFVLFILASALVSAALIPVLLTVRPAPRVEAPSKMTIFDLYRNSPLAVIGGIGNGLANGAFIGLSVVYAQRLGYSVSDSALFLTVGILGAGILQWPLGYVSDRFDRRLIITLVVFAAAGLAFAAATFDMRERSTAMVLIFLYGGTMIPLYSLFLAHMNDHLRQDQMVAAASGFVLLVGTSAAFGPIVSSWLMDRFGDSSFFGFQSVVLIATGGFAIWRMTQRSGVALEDQTSPLYVSRFSSVAAASAMEIAQENDTDEDAEEVRN